MTNLCGLNGFEPPLLVHGIGNKCSDEFVQPKMTTACSCVFVVVYSSVVVAPIWYGMFELGPFCAVFLCGLSSLAMILTGCFVTVFGHNLYL